MMTRTPIRFAGFAGLVIALLAGLTACGGGGESATGGPVTLRYGLWDSNQQPIYQKCADAFQKENPNIRVNIQLNNWNDYWGGLARGFIGETAPDVFTDHLAKYPQFAQSDVILPLNRYADRDGVGTSQYQPGLADLWQTPDGQRYGFPKDWDTVAVVSNQAMLAKAGITKEQLDSATWNPTDGGSVERIAARLSVDAKGVRGDQPGYDAAHVAVYGLGLDPGGLTYGQTTWAGFARSLGFELLDKNPWGTHYNYDDPRLAQTIGWWQRMVRKGYMPPLSQARTLGQTAMFQGGKIALAIDGDWTISSYTSSEGLKVGFSPQPSGPEGSWSMYNGLADSIWVGTKHPDEAWTWVKFLASPACQNIVGASAVVFPAIPAATQKAVQTHQAKGVDVTAFTSYLNNQHTLLYPITGLAPQIDLLVGPTMEKILIGDQHAGPALTKVNTQVNNLLKYQAGNQ
jgi:multiple sugar transport system substrate-binding protein